MDCCLPLGRLIRALFYRAGDFARIVLQVYLFALFLQLSLNHFNESLLFNHLFLIVNKLLANFNAC